MKATRRMRELLVRVAPTFAATSMLVLLSVSCGDDPPPPPPPKPANTGAPAAGGHGAPAPAAAAPKPGGSARPAGPPMPELPERVFTESDFSETDKNRDPFRGFAQVFAQQARGKTVIQRQVVVDRYALDELKLAGVVTRTDARALFIDPNNVGWVVRTGDYVGKPEIVRAGGAAGIDVAINWRVDRIREGDVVFVREDPAHPEIAPVTRVIPLFPTEEGKQGRP